MTDHTYRPGLRLLSVALACGYAALTACSSADGDLARDSDRLRERLKTCPGAYHPGGERAAAEAAVA